MQRPDDALAQRNRAIELNPGDARAIARRGSTFVSLQRYEEALADFNRAIELDPDYAWAIARRGRTQWQMKRYGETLADLKRLRKLMGSDRFLSECSRRLEASRRSAKGRKRAI